MRLIVVCILIPRRDVTLSVWGGCSTMMRLMGLRDEFYVITPTPERHAYV